MTEDAGVERTMSEAADQYVRALRDARARQPGRSILFPALGDARMRRQIVRWLGETLDAPTEGALEVLRTALDDGDWEVRASAMLVAARLHAATLRSAVAAVQLPAAGQFALDEHDEHLLVAARLIALTSLECAESAEAEEAILKTLQDVPRHLVRTVIGLPVDHRDDAWLLLHSLATPTALGDPLPELLPIGLTRVDRRIVLGADIEMVWVSPIPHILGGDSRTIRDYTPTSGFFMSRRPIARAHPVGADLDESARLGAAIAERLSQTPEPPVVASIESAYEICVRLTQHTGAVVSVPSAEELECAARGTDGRRFPWGNGSERMNGRERSPHGIERFVVPIGQWTSTFDDERRPLSMGGPASPRCNTRAATSDPQSVRVIVRT